MNTATRFGSAVVLLGSGAAGAAVAMGDGPPLQLLDTGVRVEPLRVAPAVSVGGRIDRTGDWIEYPNGASRRRGDCFDERVFDCFGDHDHDGFPDDAGGCGLSSSRWFFGTGYCNGFVTNDMTMTDKATPDGGAWRTDLAWYWTGPGYGSEQCVMAIFTEESYAAECEEDSFDYAGWLIDFGELECNTGGYVLASVDLGQVGEWELPATGVGSYCLMYLTDDGEALATCAQPMLWGSSNNFGDPDGPGTQESAQLDDDRPRDGIHEISAECYTYEFECPSPLGAMAQFWGTRTDTTPCASGDCNEDCTINTLDVTCFLNLWSARDPAADCNRDGRVDTQDVLCFLNHWTSC